MLQQEAVGGTDLKLSYSNLSSPHSYSILNFSRSVPGLTQMEDGAIEVY